MFILRLILLLRVLWLLQPTGAVVVWKYWGRQKHMPAPQLY